MPDLLSSLHDIAVSSSGSVSILADIDEQANCAGVDGLAITATIAEGARIISTQETAFADATITFESISPGDYTCSVTVEDGTGPIETMQIPCVSSARELGCCHYSYIYDNT